MRLHDRIMQALNECRDGRSDYHSLMRMVWPPNDYPRAYRHSVNGGPPGVAMVYGRALRELRECGFISRIRLYIGVAEKRFGQEDVQLLSGGRKKIAENKL